MHAEIIRNHIIDSLQYALRDHGQIFTSKEIEWLAKWDDASCESARPKTRNSPVHRVRCGRRSIRFARQMPA
jgi:hypothetical protein